MCELWCYEKRKEVSTSGVFLDSPVHYRLAIDNRYWHLCTRLVSREWIKMKGYYNVVDANNNVMFPRYQRKDNGDEEIGFTEHRANEIVQDLKEMNPKRDYGVVYVLEEQSSL